MTKLTSIASLLYIVCLMLLIEVDAQGIRTTGCHKDIIMKIRSGATMQGVPFDSHRGETYLSCVAKCRAKTGPPDHCFGVEFHAGTSDCRLMKKGVGSQTVWRRSPLWFHFERYCLQVKAFARIGTVLGPIAVKMGQADFMACSNRLWTRNAAKATCKSFGLKDGIPVTHLCNMPFEFNLVRPENRTFHKVSCRGNEANLLDCRGELDPNPCPGDKYASVKCFKDPLAPDAEEMKTRLHFYTNNTANQNWGMVQIRHLGHWAGVCELTDREAKVICKEVNNKYKDGVALFASRWARRTADFGMREPVYSLRKMSCNPGSQGVRSCSFDDVCKLTPFCHTNGLAHILCTTRPVFDGAVQLTDGHQDSTSRSGRVETRFEGTWGTVLSNENWTPVEATAVCKELNYKYGVTKHMLTTSSKPVLMSDVYCYGEEDKLRRCRLARGWKNPHPLSLATRRDAGVTCSNDVAFQLANGGPRYRGRVELNVAGSNGPWGTICSDLWGETETTVLCAQLGFNHGGKILRYTPFGRGAGPILLHEVQCVGTEANILDCKHKPFGVHNCTHYRDLSIECNTQAAGGGFALFQPVDRDFVFTHRPQNITTVIGKARVLLQCAASKSAVIVWKHDGFRVDAVFDPGYVLHRGGVLEIRNIQRHHAGMYTCEARKVGPDDAVIRAHAWLKIPNFSDDECEQYIDESPDNITARKDSTVILKCYSNSAVNTLWLKDGTPVIPDGRNEIMVNGYLNIKQVSTEDEGTYTCNLTIRTPDNKVCHADRKAKLVVFENLDEVCGTPIINQPRISPDESRGYIIGGSEARPGSAPWQAMLTMRTKQWQPACGGVIVSESIVATAAHCLRNPTYPVHTGEDIKVKVGKHARAREAGREGVYTVEDILVHEHFDQNNYDNDIAILKLSTKMTFDDYVRPICIGEEDHLYNLMRPGMYGTLTGWGQLDNLGTLPEVLNEIRLPVVDRDLCGNSTSHLFSDNMFCAGFSQAARGDSCKGDSGGPFSVKDPATNKWYLGGVVSWGSKKCGQQGKYGYYTKIEKYVGWLGFFIGLP